VVKRIRRSWKFLTPTKNDKGYMVIGLNGNDGKRMWKRVHILVLSAFKKNPNPLKYDQVNHKDGVKSNNNLDNLEWSNNSLNQIHAIKLGLRKAQNRKHYTKKPQNI
jgi:hypothetical protein